MTNDIGAYIIRRGRRFTFRRRVPVDLADVLGGYVKISLKTDSMEAARQAAVRVNAEVVAYWDSLRATGKAEAIKDRYAKARDLAARLGWSYRPVEELIDDAPAHEVVERLEALSGVSDRRVTTAVLGAAAKPDLMLSSWLEEYENLTRDQRVDKSENQARKSLQPYARSLRNFIAKVKDKRVADIDRNDVLAFRAWWSERITGEGLTAKSANKEMNCLRAMYRAVNDAHQYSRDNPFRDVSFAMKGGVKGKKRGATVPAQWVYDTVLKPGCPMDGMNDEARLIVAILAETGARPGEICGLLPDEFILNHAIPHVRIQHNAIREIKNAWSDRKIPLVGAALPAAHALLKAGGIDRYLGKNDVFSTAVNKFLNGNHAFENRQQSLYSLRHCFEDRMTVLEVPDKVAASLMGHKFHREKYGSGPSLKQKHEWLLKMALMPPSSDRSSGFAIDRVG
ncbi:phage integrase [Thalassospira sp. SM2505]